MARVLIIDDEPEVRTFVAGILNAAGHEVSVAADGVEGMKQHRASPADLVITDLYMPVQEGLETIQALHSWFPEVPIIAMTGRAGTMLAVARRLGAGEVLAKPFAASELIAAVEKALGGKPPAK